jgi:DNA-binding MarR family transcriptional regulator
VIWKKRKLPETGTSQKRQDVDLPGWNIDQLNYPTFRLTLIAKIMDRLTVRYLTERGDLIYREWRVLARLGAMDDGGTVGQVAELAWVDRAEVSRAASALEARGLVERRENPHDLRVPVLSLTKKGRKLYLVALRERAAFHESLLVDLSETEREALDDLLARVGQRLLHVLKDQQTPAALPTKRRVRP